MDIQQFTTSKRQMFDVSINLFASQNFEIISMSDIATATGRSVAAIYNHFKSKQEVLAVAYEFFEEHCFDTMLPVTAFEPMVREASLLQIIRAMMFEFIDDYAYLLQQILCIIFQRGVLTKKRRKSTQTSLSSRVLIMREMCLTIWL